MDQELSGRFHGSLSGLLSGVWTVKVGSDSSQMDTNTRAIPLSDLRTHVPEERLDVFPADASPGWCRKNGSQRAVVLPHVVTAPRS